jgi:hypothetical protein
MGYIVVVVMPWSLLAGSQSVAPLRELALYSLCVKRKGKKHAIGHTVCVGEPLAGDDEGRGREKASLRGTLCQPQIVRIHDKVFPVWRGEHLPASDSAQG